MDDIIDKLGFLSGGSRFRRIYEKLQIGGDKVYKEAGVNFKSTWFPVYFVLSKSQESQTVMEITNQIAFTHITVKNIVKELEREGLVEIVSNPDDKRSKLISLSNNGKKLIEQLEPLWLKFSKALKNILTSGHPDIINILKRIDTKLSLKSLNEEIKENTDDSLVILDYRPDLKPYFYELAGYWLSGFLRGKLEDEDEFTLRKPEKAYIEQGGFLFFAQFNGEVAGCVALKRLTEEKFELAKLFVDPKFRGLGIATRLVERCITRCIENQVTELWLQTTLSMKEAHKLYYKLGFNDGEPPSQLTVLKRTEKVMYIGL